MLNSYELSIPKLPGFDMGEWLRDQANIVQNLAQRANRVSPPQSMDQLQTMPFEVEDIWFKKNQGPCQILFFIHVHPLIVSRLYPYLQVEYVRVCSWVLNNFPITVHVIFPILFALQPSALTRH